jgi:hypothetical protein
MDFLAIFRPCNNVVGTNGGRFGTLSRGTYPESIYVCTAGRGVCSSNKIRCSENRDSVVPTIYDGIPVIKIGGSGATDFGY